LWTLGLSLTLIPMHSHARFLVLTGGPGAGKTAVMSAARQIFGSRISLLPESASIVYSGGFPRFHTPISIRAAQRAICRVQEELERFSAECAQPLSLCDRGIADGAAYWPEGIDDFFIANGYAKETIFSRYHTVIHLKTPSREMGYNHENPMRTESAEEAAALDGKIEKAWEGHPNRIIVPATESFREKLDQVTDLIHSALKTLEFSLPTRSPGNFTLH